MQQDQRLAGMGTTFVALLVNAEAAYVAHAGDSRCYRLQGGRIMFRTADHSLVGELVRSKALTEEQARTSPQANLITRGLGSVNNSQPDVDVVPYRAGNRFVLCTDGVWGMMNQVELVGKFRALRNLQTDVPRLCDEIDRLGFRQGGRHDNHTLIVVDVEANSQLKDGVWSAEGLKGLAKGKWKWVMGAAGGLTLCLMVGVGIAFLWDGFSLPILKYLPVASSCILSGSMSQGCDFFGKHSSTAPFIRVMLFSVGSVLLCAMCEMV